MNLLFIAAQPRELSPLLSRCSETARLVEGLDWAWSGSLNGNRLLLAANGAGWKRASAAVEAALGVFEPDAVISTGFCGALDPALKVADIVVGTGVEARGQWWPAALPAQAPRYRPGIVLSHERVAQTAREKQILRERGGDIVEMEAAGVAETCVRKGLPFYCIRAVSDLADESFGIDFNRVLREDGHFDTIGILRESLRRPAASLPELLRLRNRCVLAARALGDFFAECRF